MTHPTGPEAAALSPTDRKSLVEAAHRQHAAQAWRELLAMERRDVTIDDVLNQLGYADEGALRTALEEEFQGYEYDRLIAGVKDEIAIKRAELKLPMEVWRRFNLET